MRDWGAIAYLSQNLRRKPPDALAPALKTFISRLLHRQFGCLSAKSL
jgi:hypothetical protein